MAVTRSWGLPWGFVAVCLGPARTHIVQGQVACGVSSGFVPDRGPRGGALRPLLLNAHPEEVMLNLEHDSSQRRRACNCCSLVGSQHRGVVATQSFSGAVSGKVGDENGAGGRLLADDTTAIAEVEGARKQSFFLCK